MSSAHQPHDRPTTVSGYDWRRELGPITWFLIALAAAIVIALAVFPDAISRFFFGS